MNDSVPYVALCREPRDACVFGVVNVSPSGQLMVNSLGEGAVWVCDANGALENGDYVCSSAVPGYAMRQEEEWVEAFTAAKTLFAVDFEPVAAGHAWPQYPSPPTEVAEEEATTTAPNEGEGEEEATAAAPTEGEGEEEATAAAPTEGEGEEEATAAASGDLEGAAVGEGQGDGDAAPEEVFTEGALESLAASPGIPPMPTYYGRTAGTTYELRYLRLGAASGRPTVITREEWLAEQEKGEPVLRAAFVGCTYHCG